MREFIRTNKAEIDQAVRTYLKQPDFPMNDEERRAWIMNDEGLYNWARRSGVRI